VISAIVTSHWFFVAQASDRTPQQPSPMTAPLLHRLGSSSALHYLGIHQLLKDYYAEPAATRQPFGIFAQKHVERTGTAERLRNLSDRLLRFSFIPASDDTLVLRVVIRTLPGQGVGDTPGDSTGLQGRLLVTAQGASYAIDR
jgi:hypothetical protein